MSSRSLPLALLLALALVPLIPAETPRVGPAEAVAEVRGKAFEVSGLVGIADWQPKVGLKPCAWYGGMAGHRFEAVAERLHLGFRATWEGCITALDVESAPRIDMILIGGHFNYGIKPVDWMMVYGQMGAGMMLADQTPSGGATTPRMTFMGGPGVIVTLGKYFFFDASLRFMIFENFQFGTLGGQAGNAVNPVAALIIGAQI
ncbi:MAG: hypothetical protein KDA24_14800 [Deltaproteobacteria bacterium]|nr:hypothetical protein [Deltaproteobacteria bacterium]